MDTLSRDNRHRLSERLRADDSFRATEMKYLRAEDDMWRRRLQPYTTRS